MDAFVTKPAAAAAAPLKDSAIDDSAARAAWHALAKPVTEESFVAWYMSQPQLGAPTPKKKRAAAAPAAAAPTAKKQATMPGAGAILPKGKRNALIKAVSTSLKAAIKGQKAKWHAGDAKTLPGSAVVDAADFALLFSGAAMTKKGVTTSFALVDASLAAAFGDFKCSVPTWSRTRRSFEKAYKTGSEAVTIKSAAGKYSTGTSTVTLKFDLQIAGGYGRGGDGGADY